MVLIALFLYFNVFMFMLDRNTAFQDTVSQSIQMDATRNAEQVTISNLAIPWVQGNQLNVTCSISNAGPISVQLVRLWALDNNIQKYGSVATSITLLPGNTTTYSGNVNIAGASSSDFFTIWFVTARGNLVTLPTASSATLAAISQVMGDFLQTTTPYNGRRSILMDLFMGIGPAVGYCPAAVRGT